MRPGRGPLLGTRIAAQPSRPAVSPARQHTPTQQARLLGLSGPPTGPKERDSGMRTFYIRAGQARVRAGNQGSIGGWEAQEIWERKLREARPGDTSCKASSES